MRNVILSEEEIKREIEIFKQWLEKSKTEAVEEMAEFFANRIHLYEDVHLKNWSEEYRYMATLIPRQTRRLMDIGCGTGLELDEIYKLLPGLAVTGIDLSETMLQKLREKHRERNLALIRADYFEYPFEEQKYDGALSFMTLHHFPYEKKGRIYQKLYDALTKGGFYLECDYMALNDEYEKLCLEQYERRRAGSGLPDGAFVHIDIPLTVERQMELMDSAGFTGIERLYQNKTTVLLKARKA